VEPHKADPGPSGPEPLVVKFWAVSYLRVANKNPAAPRAVAAKRRKPMMDKSGVVSIGEISVVGGPLQTHPYPVMRRRSDP